MRSRLHLRPRLLLPAAALVLAGAACAPASDSDSSASSSSDESSRPTTSASSVPSTGSSAPATAAATVVSADCMKDALDLREAGTLTVGTDSPAYDPWFSDDDPTNGKGYESAVAYEVAKRLGFSADEVTWVTVPFNTSYKPGDKTFDLDINQVSITPARAKVVDFSDGYYSATQAVIALKDSPAAAATSVADLASYKLGAQTGTTSLTAIRETIKPDTEPGVLEDTNQAKQELLNGQLDAIVADLPTAFYITSVEIPKATIIGQFEAEAGADEQFGMLFEKGSSLVPCVDEALAAMKADGTLDGLEQQWLSDTVGVPVLP